jgi:polysaccharide biosynthesis/export protein
MKLFHKRLGVTQNSLGAIGIFAISLLWLSGGVGWGQSVGNPVGKMDAAQPASSTLSSGVLVASDEDYRIGINDVIEVQIEDATELSGIYRIAKSGTFLMPFLGRIAAQNKTPEELTKFITDGLRDRYLSNPSVRVVIRQYNSRSFFIQGAVRSPGVFQVEGKPSLLVLLTLAGGLTENHSSTGFILRPNKQTSAASESITPNENGEKRLEQEAQTAAAQTEYSLLKVNLSGLLVGRFEQNMYLEPGDIVNIPQSELFFVAGEVQKPGSFTVREGTTLRHAVSLAQGTNFKADMKRGIIFREEAGTGKKKEINVDLAAIMSGKQDDIPILPNDIVYVPNSKMKTVAAPLLQAFGVNAMMRMPIY